MLDQFIIFVIFFVSLVVFASFFSYSAKLVYGVGVAFFLPTLYVGWSRLIWKERAFREATKIIFQKDKKSERAHWENCWRIVWRRTIWRLLLCKFPDGWKHRDGHFNVKDNQDLDILVDKSWPEFHEFETSSRGGGISPTKKKGE